MTSPFDWIKSDETAKESLFRILPPPLHRLPFRLGNVVEIVGPSPSAKTLILIQAAVNCILPKDWKGVHYGGLDRAVIFVDLECRFDVLSLARALKQRIHGMGGRIDVKWSEDGYDKELFASCMKRFLYFRCYNSLEFLATLKTMHCQLQKEKETQDRVYMLMIDSIGAFYWVDRALHSTSSGSDNRKSYSFQSMTEAIVQEIQKLLRMHPMLVLGAKAALFADKQYTSEVIKKLREKTP